LTCCKTVA